MPHRSPCPDARGVYVDYLDRWAWSVDSQGRKSALHPFFSPEEREQVQAELWRELDASDPIPSAAFVPAPHPRPVRTHTLRLI